MKAKMIPLDKMTKKQQHAYYASRRGNWGEVNPVTRVVPDKTRVSRRKARQDLMREV